MTHGNSGWSSGAAKCGVLRREAKQHERFYLEATCTLKHPGDNRKVSKLKGQDHSGSVLIILLANNDESWLLNNYQSTMLNHGKVMLVMVVLSNGRSWSLVDLCS